MHQFTIHTAKTHLSRLINQALNGEDVVIARGKIPLVRITPLKNAKVLRRIGGAKGIIKKMSDDFCAPLQDFTEYMK